MFTTKNIISQLQAEISRYDFENMVIQHGGDKSVKHFRTKDLISALMFGQITGKESLRGIVDSLDFHKSHNYHMGIHNVSRNNFSHALKNRPYQIVEDLYYHLLGKFSKEIQGKTDERFKFKNPLKSIDSSTISLCLSQFDWAEFRSTKAGIKLHTLIDNRSQVAEFIYISNAKANDVKFYDKYPILENNIYTMDKAYLKFKFLRKIHEKKAFFVLRSKDNTQFSIISRNIDKPKNIKADWVIKFDGVASKDYSEPLRLVKYYDAAKKETYSYLTNIYHLSAQSIADIYKARWDVELFFKWIKQNLKIKKFYGTSENAVKFQIWVALIVHLIIAYLKYKLKSKSSILEIFRKLSDSIFKNIFLQELILPSVKVNRRQVRKKQVPQLLLNFLGH